MEDDRAEVDLGIAADIEEQDTRRQPKKRFVGRKQAAAAAINGPASVEDSGAIQGRSLYKAHVEVVEFWDQPQT